MNNNSRVLQVKGNKITSPFGNRTITYTSGPAKGTTVTKNHNGIDIVGAGSTLDYIVAHSAGTVQAAGFDSACGYYANILTASGAVMVYYHMKKGSLKVKTGDKVKQGQVLGYMGATGNVTGAHLHFGIKVDGKWIDPAPYINADYTTGKDLDIESGGAKLAKYIINTFPQDQFMFRMYHNTDKKTWQKIKQETGCYGLINTSYFNMKTFAVDSGTMIAGEWVDAPKYHEYGICIDANGKLTVGTEKNAVYDFTFGLPPCYINGVQYNKTEHGRNGASFIGVAANGDVTCLIADKENGMTTTECCSTLLGKGCINIFRFDGSWSSQGSLGPNLNLDPSQERKAAVYMLIFKRKTATVPNTDTIKEVDVRHIQKELNLRYRFGIAEDNAWGPASKRAMVKAVQIEINRLYNETLVIDGLWGPKCKLACPNIRSVTRNNLAWLIQACLVIKGYDVELDGAYGPACEVVIKTFQTDKNLADDGVCGANTMTELLR